MSRGMDMMLQRFEPDYASPANARKDRVTFPSERVAENCWATTKLARDDLRADQLRPSGCPRHAGAVRCETPYL